MSQREGRGESDELKFGKTEMRRVVILPTVWSKSSNLSTWRLPQCLRFMPDRLAGSIPSAQSVTEQECRRIPSIADQGA